MAQSVKGNKAELASALGVSLPTLSQWLLRYGPDFPIESRGSNGVGYVFDFAAVFNFLRARQEEEARSAAVKDEQLAQLLLPFETPVEVAAPAGMSLQDQNRAVDLRRKLREERVEAGELVPAEPMVDGVGKIIARLSRDMRAFVRQLGREQGWPESYIANVNSRYADLLRAAVSDLDDQFTRGSVSEAMERAN